MNGKKLNFNNKNKLLFSLSSDKIYIRNECKHKRSNNNNNSNDVNAFLSFIEYPK
jgi:hypothetical protein